MKLTKEKIKGVNLIKTKEKVISHEAIAFLPIARHYRRSCTLNVLFKDQIMALSHSNFLVLPWPLLSNVTTSARVTNMVAKRQLRHAKSPAGMLEDLAHGMLSHPGSDRCPKVPLPLPLARPSPSGGAAGAASRPEAGEEGSEIKPWLSTTSTRSCTSG